MSVIVWSLIPKFSFDCISHQFFSCNTPLSLSISVYHSGNGTFLIESDGDIRYKIVPFYNWHKVRVTILISINKFFQNEFLISINQSFQLLSINDVRVVKQWKQHFTLFQKFTLFQHLLTTYCIIYKFYVIRYYHLHKGTAISSNDRRKANIYKKKGRPEEKQNKELISRTRYKHFHL